MNLHKSEFRTVALCLSVLADREGEDVAGVLMKFNHGLLSDKEISFLARRVERHGRVKAKDLSSATRVRKSVESHMPVSQPLSAKYGILAFVSFFGLIWILRCIAGPMP